MRLWRRTKSEDTRPAEERLEEAQQVLVDSQESLAKIEELSETSAAIAARLRKELKQNHFAPALREAIARSVR